MICARQLQIWIKGLSRWGLFIDNTKQAVKFVTLNKNFELGWPGLDSLVKRGAECWQIVPGGKKRNEATSVTLMAKKVEKAATEATTTASAVVRVGWPSLDSAFFQVAAASSLKVGHEAT